MIEATGLGRSFGLTSIVKNVSFKIPNGNIVGFLGPNGAGKTTTIRMLTTFLPPSRGEAVVGGYSVTRDPRDVARSVGYLPESMPIHPEMRVREYLRYRAQIKGLKRREIRSRIDELAEQCALTGALRKAMKHLSRGFRQRVGLADALLADPPVLILDEPTAGLDPKQVVEVRTLISSLRGQKTVLFSSHILGEIEQVCDRVIVLAGGEIKFDSDLQDWRELQTSQQTVVVELEGGESVPLSLIQELEGVIDVNNEAGRVRITAERDVRPEIYALSVRQQWKLVTLYREDPSLETLFLSATEGEDAPA